MRWFRIPKEQATKPSHGTKYSHWKEYLAEEGKHQCVYCAISVQAYGGLRNFHVEHYRPKSNELFKHLEHELSNLYFACSICNCFKGDAWPNEPCDKFSNHSFPDPSKFDYSNLFINTNNFKLTSHTLAGRYMIEKLYLNRPQLILERKHMFLIQSLVKELDIISEIIKQVEHIDPNNSLLSIFKATIETIRILCKEKNVIPYSISQISR